MRVPARDRPVPAASTRSTAARRLDPRHEHALLLQRQLGNRAAARLLARVPGKDTARTYGNVTPELFSPALTDTGAFSGAGMQQEETWIRNLREREAERRGDNAPVSDADVRVDMLEPRIAEAERQRQQATGGKAGGKNLGVFLGPEWFFKRPGTPYTEADRDHIIARLCQISQRFPELLIVPGTILWRRAPQRRKGKGLMANSAPVIYGGDLVHMVHKHNINGDTEGYDKEQSAEEWANFQASAQIEHFFDIDNVRFVLEICGDHAERFASREYDKDPTMRKADTALLVSHGASSALASNTMVVEGGRMFHSDSAPPTSGGDFGSALVYKITPSGKARRTVEFKKQGAEHQSDPRENPDYLHGGIYAL
jgi:hypothetical protein